MLGDDIAEATRAAWLHHAGGLTQSDVARRLGVTGVKAHRMIARAMRAGAVRVLVDGPLGSCLHLEERLSSAYDLSFCRVVPGLDENGLPLRAVGIAAASVLRAALTSGRHAVIGFGHGRTLGAAIERLPRVAASLRIVSLLGGITQRTGTNPFDVIHRLAEKSGAEAWLMPVPFFANSEADRRVLLAQRGIEEARRVAGAASFSLVGVGEIGPHSFLASCGVLTAEEISELTASGASGEVLGHFFDARGAEIETGLHARVISIVPKADSNRSVIAVAGGAEKARAIAAVLRSGVTNGLITDEPTAQILLEDAAAGADNTGRME